MRYSRQRVKRVRPLLGTFVEIEVEGHFSPERLNRWITAGFETINEIDQLMSVYRADSDLSRLNSTAPGKWIRVNRHTANVLEASNRLHKESNGLFDIRSGDIPLPKFEQFRVTPVEVAGCRARKNGPWTVDLGGIAKGYAVDRAVEKIRALSRGSECSGTVNAGGDLRQWDSKGDSVAVATSAVRSGECANRLSPAIHRRMPEGKVITRPKAATVLSNRCLWSDALTKILLTGSRAAVRKCLRRYSAYGLVFKEEGKRILAIQ